MNTPHRPRRHRSVLAPDARFEGKKRVLVRTAPAGAVISTIALAVFVVALIDVRNVNNGVVRAAEEGFALGRWGNEGKEELTGSNSDSNLQQHGQGKLRAENGASLTSSEGAQRPTQAVSVSTVSDEKALEVRKSIDDANEVSISAQQAHQELVERHQTNDGAQMRSVRGDGHDEYKSASSVRLPVSAAGGDPDNENEEDADEVEKVALDQEPKQVGESGKVGWNRSWPLTPYHDDGKVIPLVERFGFTNRTLLNYFHMHKTGGVTTKVELMHMLDRAQNKLLMTKRGTRMRFLTTCYQVEVQSARRDKSIEKSWRCDFGKAKNMTKEALQAIDIVMGHQYWDEGCESLFGDTRDVRHFSIFRHPLSRKLSFFYHFFVRNFERDEKSVSMDEVIRFLLDVDMPNDPRVRDAGPNYYASRLLSNGITGYKGFRFDIPEGKEDEFIGRVLDRLEHKFAFVGLQLQGAASQCMLQKSVQVFAHVHGIDTMVGTELLGMSSQRLNSGKYPWTAKEIWMGMTEGQRRRYREVEKVDLAIYDAVVKRFRRDVSAFGCAEAIRDSAWEEDMFE